MKYNFLKQTKAFGIVELVISLVIFTVAITAVVTLLSRVILASIRSEADLVALNLSREGIEIIRHIRDSNWLASEKWDSGLSENNDRTGIPVFINGVWNIDFTPDSINDDGTQLFKDPVTQGYVHETSGESTLYKRLLVLKGICIDSILEERILDDNQTCLPTEELVGYEVHSHVSWKRSTQSRNVELVTKLYNWR